MMAAPLTPTGLSPYSGVNVNPFMVPQAAHPLQQIQQLLQTVPQQVQQLLQLSYWQQHQLQQLQQVLQYIPAQLAQVQQIQQAQQVQQTPFGSTGISTFPLWSATPQIPTQPGYLM